jgi:chromatin remodeling complex protein RSC6
MVKKTKKTTKKVVSKKTTPPPVPTPPPAKDVKAPVDTTPTLNQQFTELLAQLASIRTQLTAVTSQTRTLAKRSEREVRAALKAGRKRPRKSGNRAPSGFVKPTLISQELANFLKKPTGTEMARTQVTREINKYIVEHKLQDPSNGRKILADLKLRNLLKITKEDELTYFNLQKYMSPHFAKSGQPFPGGSSSSA